MLTDDYLICERDAGISGTQRIYRFPDGHGLSVVNGPAIHCYSFAREIAVLENVSEDGGSFVLTYDTTLTDDVETFSTDEEANDFILKAIALFCNAPSKKIYQRNN